MADGLTDHRDDGPLAGVSTAEVLDVLGSTRTQAAPGPSEPPKPQAPKTAQGSGAAPAPSTPLKGQAAGSPPTPAQAQTPGQPQGSQQQLQAPATPGQPGAQQPDGGQQAQPGQQPVPGTPTPEEKMRAMELELAEMRGRLAGGPQAQQQNPGGQQQPQGPLDVLPSYAYNIPDQLQVGLNSEDPAVQKQALGALLQGVSQTVHRNLAQAVQQFIPHFIGQVVPQLVQGQLLSHQIQTDFYGTYSELDNPAIKPMIAQVAHDIFTRTGAQAWTPQLKQQIAQAVYQTLGRQMPMPGQQPGQQFMPQPQILPQTPPPAMVGGSPARAGAPNGRMSVADDIARTLEF